MGWRVEDIPTLFQAMCEAQRVYGSPSSQSQRSSSQHRKVTRKETVTEVGRVGFVRGLTRLGVGITRPQAMDVFDHCDESTPRRKIESH